MSAPRTPGTRPILDRVKTSIFDWLGTRLALPGTLPPVNVLDLFAGSGAFGLEALSRGAAHCCFVERGGAALRTLRANIDTLSCQADTEVRAADAMTVDLRCPWEGGYGVCFIDPPYRYSKDASARRRLERLLERVVSSDQISDSGLILFRCESSVDLPQPPQATVIDRRTYGRMAVWWLQVSRSIHGGSGSDAQSDSA